MRVDLKSSQAPNSQGVFRKTPKLLNDFSRYNSVQKFETITLLKKIAEVKDGKVYEYRGKDIIDVKHPETFETAYAVETDFLHRLKSFVAAKYHECFKNKELNESLDNILE